MIAGKSAEANHSSAPGPKLDSQQRESYRKLVCCPIASAAQLSRATSGRPQLATGSSGAGAASRRKQLRAGQANKQTNKQRTATRTRGAFRRRAALNKHESANCVHSRSLASCNSSLVARIPASRQTKWTTSGQWRAQLPLAGRRFRRCERQASPARAAPNCAPHLRARASLSFSLSTNKCHLANLNFCCLLVGHAKLWSSGTGQARGCAQGARSYYCCPSVRLFVRPSVRLSLIWPRIFAIGHDCAPKGSLAGARFN